jgi:hypothetical protein
LLYRRLLTANRRPSTVSDALSTLALPSPSCYPTTLHRAIDNGLRLAQGAQFLPCASLIATRVVELVDKVSGSDVFRPCNLAPPWGRERYWEGLGHGSGFRSDATMLADLGTGAAASALSVTI